MKKILLLIDAFEFQGEILDFAGYIAKLGKSKLVGVFVENDVLSAMPSVKSVGGQMFVEEITLSTEEVKALDAKRKANVELFKAGCLQREVNAVVHQVRANVLKNIIHETRYADILILDPGISFTSDKSIPSKFAMDILNHAECPVLIAPEYFEQPEEVVFAYDGSRSSVFAIKQFFYQLPEFANRKITVVHIKENRSETDHTKDSAEFKEWLEMHFFNVSYFELSGDARDELFKYFIENSERYSKLLVTGSFGRSVLSSFFRPSTAELVLKAVDIPIFIAHH